MESVVCFRQYTHFHYIDSFNPRTSYFSPSVCVLLVHQRFIVFGIQVFCLIRLVLLLVCRNAGDFYALILYPKTLPNSLCPVVFWWHLRIFYIYSIMSSENNDSFTSSFPTWIPFISFSSLISMARTSKTMLMRMDILVLFLILGETLSVFHH